MKAILVINMPEQCDDCDFCQGGDWLSYLCGLTGEEFEFVNGERKHFCPLKPMPKKINVDNIKDTIHTEFQTPSAIYDTFRAKIQLDTDKLIAIGYNMCVDEILGDE